MFTFNAIIPQFDGDTQSRITFKDSNLDEGMNRLMNIFYQNLGNGDSENGGMGSLWRCAKDIYDCLRGGFHYCYADCEFWVDGISKI